MSKSSKPLRVCYADFEFNGVVEPKLNLVCAATLDNTTGEKKKFWLHKNPKEQNSLANHFKKYDCVIAYQVVAEARSLLALDLDPLGFKWIDLMLEYRLISNHNDNMNWGKQLADGKVKFVKKPLPKWERGEDDAAGFRPTHSLAEATYKLTGQIRDTEHKNKMRDLIISTPDTFTQEEREAIMDYCMDDVVFLPRIFKEIKKEYARLAPNDTKTYTGEAFLRGRYAAHTAIMENNGYPIDLEKTKNFAKSVPNILYDLQREINELFPDIKPFKWKKAEQRFAWNQVATKEWVAKNHDVKKWLKTDTNAISLSLKAWEKYYQFKHDYPTDNFGAQIVRYLKLKQSLYGFAVSDTSGKKTFFDSVGSDERVRPYLNIYGAQSSRSQPGATGFMFLKPAWMRALVIPKPGRFMASIDYASQEFFGQGLISGDDNMIDAYLSGDPYLATGKLAGAIPQDATKATHGRDRDLFKATTLGIGYLMSKYGLAIKLTNDTGRFWDEDEAQEQIDLFYEAYPDLKEWQETLIEDYRNGNHIKLPCGWRMWGDNDNHRSVTNVPIQGYGASVMRKAVDLSVAKGCQISFTLHDALYIEGKVGNENQILDLRDAMIDAFSFYAPEKYKKVAREIRLDPFAWSPDYEPDSELILGPEKWKVDSSNLYVDARSIVDYNKFSQYFSTPVEDLL